MKKSISYKEATKTILAIFMLNLIVDMLKQGNPGRSTRKFDEFGGNLKIRKCQENRNNAAKSYDFPG
jgi:hypothetical protein